MSNYVKSTNFASKDSLPTGDPLKIVKGTEIDTEFNNIATAVASKADTNSPTFTGTPVAPTASVGTNTTQLATTAHVYATGALKADKATTVSAGTGLSGGGDLSANRTLAIANTGVTASTYGSSSAIPVLAINSQGQVTSASTVAAASPVVLVEGEYATNTTHSVAVNTTRPILITLAYSGGQGGNASIYGRFQWGLGGLTSSRVFANATVNYQVHVSDTQMVTLTPSGSTTIQFRVDTTNLDGTYGAPSTMRVTAVQL